jgi:hypothetical protein
MATLNAIFSQANTEEQTLENEGQTVYNQQMAESQAATVAGNQDIQQANAANQNAATQTQNASSEAQVMATTGSSGTLYQQNLTSQNSIFGYNPQTLDQTQQLQNQAVGTAATALNQLQKVQGGTRGLSAAGVEAKAQGITTESNKIETELGQSIQTQENEATAAETYASSESQAQYTEEQQAEQSYTDAATQYLAEAASYQQAAQSEYNSASNYSFDAAANLASFTGAAAEVGLTALKAADSYSMQAMTTLANSMTKLDTSEATYQEQENAFNKQQDVLQAQAQQQALANYKINISAGISPSEAKKLTALVT